MAEGGGTLRELLAVFGFGVDTKELKHGENELEEFLGKVKNVAKAIAGAFLFHEVMEFGEGIAHAATNIEHLSARIGISTDQVQAWQFAAQASGFETDKLVVAMSRLQVAAAANSDSFRTIGVATKDANGAAKDAATLFADVADAVKRTEDPNKRAAIATKLFGRSGRELLPFFEEGKKGIDELLESYKELGGGIGEETIKKTKEFEKQSARLNLSITGLKDKIGRALLPVLSKMKEWAVSAVSWFTKVTKGTEIFSVALAILGIAATKFAVSMVIANLPLILMTALIVAFGLAVEDVVALLQGRESVIGDVLDKLGGKDFHKEAVEDIKNAWKGVTDVFRDLWSVIKPVKDAIAWIIDNLGKVGGFVGENLGKGTVYAANREYENSGAANTIKEQSAMTNAYRNAAKYASARARGENVPIDAYLSREPGQTKDEALQQRFGILRSQGFDTNVLPGGSTGPNVQAQTTVNMTVHAPAGIDEKQLSIQLAQQIDMYQKLGFKDAAAALQKRSGNP